MRISLFTSVISVFKSSSGQLLNPRKAFDLSTIIPVATDGLTLRHARSLAHSLSPGYFKSGSRILQSSDLPSCRPFYVFSLMSVLLIKSSLGRGQGELGEKFWDFQSKMI